MGVDAARRMVKETGVLKRRVTLLSEPATILEEER
jgi:hypothetical protein